MPARVPTSPKPKRTTVFSDARKANIIALLSLIIALLSAAATVVFSIFNYREAQQADRSAAQAQLTRYADKVAWSTSSGDSEQIEVSNRSDQTIRNVMVMTESLSAEPGLPKGAVGFVNLGNIAACTIIKYTDVLNAARISMIRSDNNYSGLGAFTGAGALPTAADASPPAHATAPPPISIAQATRQVLDFERRNDFKVKLDFLIFADANKKIWGRDDQDGLVDSSGLIAKSIIASEKGYKPSAINGVKRSASSGCS